MHARDLCLARDDALACFAVLSYRKINGVLSIKGSKTYGKADEKSKDAVKHVLDIVTPFLYLVFYIYKRQGVTISNISFTAY